MATNVTSAADLEALMDENLGGGWGDDFTQTADIDCAGILIQPIGNAGSKFTGTYNGDGYSITGYNLDSAANHAGLFGYIDGATIREYILWYWWKYLVK